jgi:hypothetical protein
MIRISGIVRLPGDVDSDIDAVLQIANDRVRLATGRKELGDWPLTQIGVERVSPRSFRMDIAGETVVFLPSNPDLFASLKFVADASRHEPARKRKKRVQEAAARHPAVEAAQVTHDVAAPVPSSPVDGETIEVDLTSQEPAEVGHSHGLLSRTRYLGAQTRDQLRQTGIWPLDRLRALRAEDSLPHEHQHSYGKVTIQAGFERRVCTECGHVSFRPVAEDVFDGSADAS